MKLKNSRMRLRSVAVVAWIFGFCVINGGGIVKAIETKVPVTFSGGHETDPRDHGRPAVLVAAALNVKPEVFRKALSGVTPARGRRPTGEEQRRNKDALMKVLGPLKVTNDRLDEVSNFYRYRPEKGEMWPTTPAKAYAVVEDGKISKIVVTEPGAGYSSPPKAMVKGLEKVRLESKVKFETDLKKNGGIASVDIVSENRENTKRQPFGRE
jgi:hypothetical protein